MRSPVVLRVPRLTVLLLSFFLALVPAWPVLAHTQLDSSEPAAGETVSSAVDTIVLTFSRPIELLDRSVRLVRHPGRVVEITLSDGGTVVTASLEPPLTDGDHEVAWRVLASDSHPREGTFAFAVVDAPAPEPTPPVTDAAPGTSAAKTPPPSTAVQDPEQPDQVELAPTFESLANLLRIVMYAGLMMAAGLTLFKAWPHRGHLEGAPILAGWIGVSATAALVASFGEAASHVATVSGKGFAGFVDASTWRSVMRTGLGDALWLRTLGLAMLAFGGFRRRRRGLPSGPDSLKLVGILVVFLSFQFLGHTASAAPAIVARASDAVHAVAGAVWIGGIVGLALLSHHGIHEGRRIAAARFSAAAVYAVAGVGVAGLALAWLNLPALDALWTTGYGQTLAAKLVFVAILGALGAYNHVAIVPAISDGDDGALARLRHVVTAEVVIVLVVLALTALLVNQSPT